MKKKVLPTLFSRLRSWLATGAIACGLLTSPAFAQSFEYPAPVVMPGDEGAHHSQLEWWYFVGHLYGVDPSGVKREYGFEVTVFQLYPLPLGNTATYSWHFAVTDVNNKLHKVEERAISDTIPGQTGGFNFTNGNWSVGGSQQNYAIKAALSDGRFAIDLKTSSALPFVLHNGNGLVDYRPIATTSSYYSSTALDTEGTIYDNGVPIKVVGVSWQDRQWFVKGTEADQGGSFFSGGWNWFAIQLDDNTQYMLYYMQDPGTGAITRKLGTRISNGVASVVPGDQMDLKPLSTWLSPQSGYTYESKWNVILPEGNLTITPLVDDQEMFWPYHRYYWEGSSQVVGTLNGKSVTGRSYVEVNPWKEPYSSLP
ncbi:carotenoid 1,2-hydratase [Xanthomonas translucens pv. graminis]|uniref:lipocalin-like domain-containing protein n=1 Tax=Xanthomonas graminis TaxID=3390026 RepID=UPI00253FA381|nr:lipocalin-like domain-containing protein [Xanthomonas translucens]WIH05374.1 carotenoid 1,2-hydratase [Xanthomonas translucens pv. graminis]